MKRKIILFNPPPSLVKVIFLLILGAIIVGCNSSDKQNSSQIRPVRTYRVQNTQISETWTYPGEIKARSESILSFRISGKMLKRPVDVGDRIRKGDLLAKMDSTDYQLAAQAMKSQLAAAKAELKFSMDELRRRRNLLRQQVISQPDLDKQETDYIATRERVAALQAQLSQTINQSSYTYLIADRSGVVTAIHAEPGQFVSTGQPILSLATENDKEAHFDVPEDKINQIKVGDILLVSIWNNQGHKAEAYISEIAASADPENRTYRVKATLAENLQGLSLGRSVIVWFSSEEQDVLGIPLSVVFTSHDHPEQTKVWLVDENKLSVTAIPIQLGKSLSENRVAVKGVQSGQLLVSAGVHRLSEGQAIRLLIEPKARLDILSVVVNHIKEKPL